MQGLAIFATLSQIIAERTKNWPQKNPVFQSTVWLFFPAWIPELPGHGAFW
jgi:hypothetical protein